MSDSNNKIEIVLKIDNLRVMKQSCLQKADLEQAIVYAEQIVKVAEKAGMNSTASEEKENLEELKQKIKRKEIVAKVKKMCEGVTEEFEHLISLGKVLNAHNIVKQFLNLHKDVEDLELIEEVKNLIKRDRKEWVNYQVNNNIH
jgi:hypothetical protein